MEKGPSEALIFMPLQMGREMSPVGRPVPNELMILGRRRSRKVGNTGVDPPNRIRNIGAIDRDFISKEEVLIQILLHPSGKKDFFLHRPSTIPHLPDLRGGFGRISSKTKKRKGEQKKDQKGFHIYHHK
jgi:hypothetical protein